MFLKAIIVIASLFIATITFATEIQFSWDANTESDLAGYAVYERLGTSTYDYSSPRIIAAAGTTTASITANQDGDYSWVLRAFDTSSNFSVDSNEVSLRVDTTAPLPPQRFRFDAKSIAIEINLQ